MNNDDKVREMLREEKVPQELEPENIRKMLDEKVPAKKRSRIKLAGRITAGAAACAVICGTAVHFAGESNVLKKDEKIINSEYDRLTGDHIGSYSDEPVLAEQKPYMSGASDYGQVYQLFNTSYEKKKEQYNQDNGHYFTNGEMAEEADFVDGDYGDYFDSAELAPETAVNGADVPKAETSEDYRGNETPTGAASAEEPMMPGDGASGEYGENEPPTETVTAAQSMPETEPEAPEDMGGTGGDDEEDHSDTFNQEAGVLEADIAKTDGKNIYYIYNNYDDHTYRSHPYMNAAAVENGHFTVSEKIDLTVSPENIFGEGYEIEGIRVNDMYVYNGSVVVVGTLEGGKESDMEPDTEYVNDGYRVTMPSYYYSYKSATFVSLYTAGDSPELISTYYQEGDYNDVRISPEGYMYLLTDYRTQSFGYFKEESLNSYIPSCGMADDVKLLPANDILMPVDDIDPASSFGYTIIGSLDLNNAGEAVPVDSKALAGYSGTIYSSAGNIYTAYGWDDTDITRISISGGSIVPAASGRVEGRVRDQFSMSEYNGYFRIATTKDTYTRYSDSGELPEDVSAGFDGSFYTVYGGRDNRLYVLDMELNTVGSVTGFGLDEEIKSVNYSGELAYVVTYEQTDPLFAIDLSAPENPVILDEFKLPGYSTYMQKWDDGLLFGFGINADENGRETGLKLNMFDNSDPNDLKLADAYVIDRTDDTWYYSFGCYERKALLIAPEKNLIGIEMVIDKEIYSEGDGYWMYDEAESGYWFFSFEDGKFVLAGQYTEPMDDDRWIVYERALYIGDYVYILSGDRFVSLSMDGFEAVDSVDF